MQPTKSENYFVATIVCLAAVVALFVVAPAAQSAECLGADRHACDDLLEAEVFFKQVPSKKLIDRCGFRAEACAVVDITNRVCTIYYATKSIDAYVLEHEMNHCRGWFHRGESKHDYRNPWVDYKTYLGE